MEREREVGRERERFTREGEGAAMATSPEGRRRAGGAAVVRRAWTRRRSATVGPAQCGGKREIREREFGEREIEREGVF